MTFGKIYENKHFNSACLVSDCDKPDLHTHIFCIKCKGFLEWLNEIDDDTDEIKDMREYLKNKNDVNINRLFCICQSC